jgi:hypothetical protein
MVAKVLNRIGPRIKVAAIDLNRLGHLTGGAVGWGETAALD